MNSTRTRLTAAALALEPGSCTAEVFARHYQAQGTKSVSIPFTIESARWTLTSHTDG